MSNEPAIEEILADLDALMPEDFNLNNEQANGIEKLWILTDQLSKVGEPEKVIEALFDFIERLSQSEEIDPRYDLGTPGPLVAALEKYKGYEQYLINSVKRYPTPLTVWMINRVINITQDTRKREVWLKILAAVNSHPLATSLVKKNVQYFLEYQAKKDTYE